MEITKISTLQLQTGVIKNMKTSLRICPITGQPRTTTMQKVVKRGGIRFLVTTFQSMLKHNKYSNHAFVVELLSKTCFEVKLITPHKKDVLEQIAEEMVSNL